MLYRNEILSYQLDDFMKYKNTNTNMPRDILPYCNNNREFTKPNIQQYLPNMKIIFDAISKGVDANDIEFKRDIKYLMNTINKKNYNDTLEKLKMLNLTSGENINFFVHELIICTMRCPIGVKGIHKEKVLKQKSLCEIIADVIKYFCVNVTKENNNNIGFHDEFVKQCRKFFMDFVNLTKSMDQNNENTSDNYKGFLTLLGLLFENGLIQHKILFECVESIKRTIFCSKVNLKFEQISNDLTAIHDKMFGYKKSFDNELYDSIIYYDTPVNNENFKYMCYRNAIECTNFYKGYDNIAHHFINLYKNKIADFVKSYEYNVRIIKSLHSRDFSYLTENNMENNEENINDAINKHTENIVNLKSFINKNLAFLEQFINSHNEFLQCNEQFYIQNKDQLIHPLKTYVMMGHEEITVELNEIHTNFTKLIKKIV